MNFNNFLERVIDDCCHDSLQKIKHVITHEEKIKHGYYMYIKTSLVIDCINTLLMVNDKCSIRNIEEVFLIDGPYFKINKKISSDILEILNKRRTQ